MKRTLLLSLLLLGCWGPPQVLPWRTDAGGGGPTDGGADGGGVQRDAGLPADQACTAVNLRRCEYLGRCGLLGESQAAQRECVAFFNATWCAQTRWPSRVAVHTVRYDGVLAQRCADDFLTRACGDWQGTSAACAGMLAANVPLRGQCYDGYQECLEGVCRGTSCPRTCQPTGLAGEVCQRDADCRSSQSLYCRVAAGTGVGLCASYGAVGLACDSELRCAAGLYCAANQCAALPAAGLPCPDGRCDDGAYCAAVDGGTCLSRQAAGDPCADDAQCFPGGLCEPLSSQCAPAAVATAGEACGPRQSCPQGLSCVGVVPPQLGACLTPGEDGAPCLWPDDCATRLSCLPGDGGTACGRRLSAGQTCRGPRDCRLLSTCLAGVCTPLPAVGASCRVVPQCQWGHCVADGDGGALCEEAAGPGAGCAVDEDCRSGHCEAGHCTAACVP